MTDKVEATNGDAPSGTRACFRPYKNRTITS